MYRIWKKLQRLQKVVRETSKPFHCINRQLEKARESLSKAQEDLLTDIIDVKRINRVRLCTQKVINVSNIKENMLRQRAKIYSIRLGDNNNCFFYATLKSKYSQSHISVLKDKDGNQLVNHDQIKKEVLIFYKDLVGKGATSLKNIDIEVMRNGSQLNSDQCSMTSAPITEKEIHYA